MSNISIPKELFERLWYFADAGIHELGGCDSRKELLLALEKNNLLHLAGEEDRDILEDAKLEFEEYKAYGEHLVAFLNESTTPTLFRDYYSKHPFRKPISLIVNENDLSVRLMSQGDTRNTVGLKYNLYDVRMPETLAGFRPIPVELNRQFFDVLNDKLSAFERYPGTNAVLSGIEAECQSYLNEFLAKYNYRPTGLGYEPNPEHAIFGFIARLSRTRLGVLDISFRTEKLVPVPISEHWLIAAKSLPNFWNLNSTQLQEYLSCRN